MVKYKNSFFIMVIVVMLFVSGCSGGPSQNSSEPNQNAEITQSESTENQPDMTEEGDGTLRIKLNLSNPDQAQDKYNLIFAQKGVIEKGEAVTENFFIKYEIRPDEELTINIEDLSSIIYSVGFDEDLQTDVTVARIEDTNIRNPLCEPIPLTFQDTTTCYQGKNITVDMTDEPLTALYPEGTFLVKIQQPENGEHAGYVDFRYDPPDGGMTLGLGRGSGGPDFLVAFAAEEFVELGIHDTVLSISDYENNLRSEKVELHFDENGYCEQGQFIIMEVLE